MDYSYKITVINKPTPDASYGTKVTEIICDDQAKVFSSLFNLMNSNYNTEFYTWKIDVHRKEI